uniref:Putative ovule protein n=1 Tax=Solanum chacoense TaxID=4108 RepID=A0A0V0HR46_SOLCH
MLQIEVDMEDGYQQDCGSALVVVALDTKAEEGSKEVALGHNNNGSEEKKNPWKNLKFIMLRLNRKQIFRTKSRTWVMI